MRSEPTFELSWRFFKDRFKEGMLGILWPILGPWKWLRRHGVSPFTATLFMLVALVVLSTVLAHFRPQLDALSAYLAKHQPPDLTPYFLYAIGGVFILVVVLLVAVAVISLVFEALSDR